jgi:hypothetical protein
MVLARQLPPPPAPSGVNAGHTLSTLLVWVLLALWAASGAVWQARRPSARLAALQVA